MAPTTKAPDPVQASISFPRTDSPDTEGTVAARESPAQLIAQVAHASGRTPERVAREVVEMLTRRLGGVQPDLVIALASEDLCTERALATLHDGLGRVPMIGCSTFGQIVDGAERPSGIAAAALKAAGLALRAYSVFDLNRDPEGHAEDLAEAIGAECRQPAAVVLLASAFSDGVEPFARRLGMLLPRETRLTGGLACGDPGTGRSFQVHGERLMTRGCAALVVDGPARAVAATMHGMVGLGRPGRVTEAAGRILRRVDDLPAVELYRRFLGERISELPEIGQVYPLGFGRPGAAPRVRAVLDADPRDGSLVLSGPVEEGTEVRVLLAQRHTLLRETRSLGEEIRRRIGPRPIRLALVVGQHGRRRFFAEDEADEFRVLAGALEPVEHVLGFRSLGSIGREGVIGSAISVVAV